MKATVNLIWNALLTAVVVTLLAGLFVAAMPPVYLATATVKGDADGILIIRSGDLIAEVTRVVKPQPDDLRSWLQELTSESTDVPTMLKQNLTVEARPGEGWLDITVQARVSVTAARLANEIASAYLSRVDQNNLTPEAMAMLFQPVEDAEAALVAFLDQHPELASFRAALQPLDRELQLRVRQVETVENKLAQIDEQRRAAKSDVTQLREASVVRALQRRDSVKQRVAEMETRYGSQHQKMIAVRAELRETEQQLSRALVDFDTRLQQRGRDARAERAQAETALQLAKAEREALLEREARHQQLKLARESALARYNGITQEQKRYEFSEAVPPPNSLGFAQLVSLLAIFFVTFLAVFLASLLRRQE